MRQSNITVRNHDFVHRDSARHSARHPVTWLLFALLAALLVATPVGARQTGSGVTLEARAGYDGFYKGDYWLPVHITAANQGPAVDGYLQITSDRVNYTTPISLPTQSHKQTTLYVYLPSFQSQLEVRLFNDSGALVATTATNRLNRLQTDELLYLVVSSEVGQLDFLGDVKGDRPDANVAYATPADLPETAVAWNNLDVLIFNDVDSGQLSLGQLAALESWLDLGGQLVITGGPGWQKTSAAFTEILPVTPTGSQSVDDLPNLRAGSGTPFRDAGPYLVTTSSLRSGRLLLYQDNLPLLAMRPQGRGIVYFLALDPKLAPLADWDGHARLWEEVALRAQRLPYWAGNVQSPYQAVSAVSSLPSLALPSSWQLLSFLLVYVIAIGPVNYAVLKRTGRRELAWLTIPAIVLLFTVASYLIGFQIKGNNIVINQMSIATGTIDSEEMRVHTVLGLYSPRRATYDLVLPADSVIRPFTQDRGTVSGAGNIKAIERGRELTVRDVRVDVSGVETFIVDSYQTAPPLSGETMLQLADGKFHLQINIQNNSELYFENVSLLIGQRFITIGDITPGESIVETQLISSSQADAAFAASGGAPGSYGGPATAGLDSDKIVGSASYYNDPKLFPRFQLVEALGSNYGGVGRRYVPAGTVTLIGWAEVPQVEADLVAREATSLGTTVYFLEIPLVQTIVSGQGVSVPAALMEQRILADSGGIYNYGSGLSLPPQTWIELEFQPWPEFQSMQVRELLLDIQQPQGSAGTAHPTVRLYDWQEELWGNLNVPVWDAPFSVANFERYVGPGNVVRVRLQNDSSSFIELSELVPTLVGDIE